MLVFIETSGHKRIIMQLKHQIYVLKILTYVCKTICKKKKKTYSANELQCSLDSMSKGK